MTVFFKYLNTLQCVWKNLRCTFIRNGKTNSRLTLKSNKFLFIDQVQCEYVGMVFFYLYHNQKVQPATRTYFQHLRRALAKTCFALQANQNCSHSLCIFYTILSVVTSVSLLVIFVFLRKIKKKSKKILKKSKLSKNFQRSKTNL